MGRTLEARAPTCPRLLPEGPTEESVILSALVSSHTDGSLYWQGLGLLLCTVKLVPAIVAWSVMYSERRYYRHVVGSGCTDAHTAIGFGAMEELVDSLVGQAFRLICIDVVMFLWFLMVLFTSRTGIRSPP